MNESMYDYIKTFISEENILRNEPMNRHTTFRVGGEAECMILVQKEEELVKLIPYLREMNKDYFILGNGSNLLVGDKGYQGVVIKLVQEMQEIRVSGNIIYAKGGALLSKVAAAAKEYSLTGMEFASGIPGTIGGAMVMNAGAYGGDMSQITESVRVMDREGQIVELNKEAMEFAYRSSVIKKEPLVVLGVKLRLEIGDAASISSLMEELSKKRRSKQPLEYPSAGSTFKRPEGYFAGKLIMDAGLSGFRIGDAMVSEKHCGFVVNAGHATAAEIRAVIDEVRQQVYDRFQVKLEPEIIFIGEFR